MVFVFATDILPQQVELVHQLVNQCSNVTDFSVDLEDCDRVLRIVASADVRFSEWVESKLMAQGIFCREL